MGILQVESTIESIEGTYKRTINDRYLAMSSISALKEKPRLLITSRHSAKRLAHVRLLKNVTKKLD